MNNQNNDTAQIKQRKRRGATMSNRKRGEIAFLVAILAYPIGLFLLGYVYVNLRSVLLAFQTYSNGAYKWVGFANITKMLNDLISDPVMSPTLMRSLRSYVALLVIGLPLNLIFAFVIYKKIPLAGFFQAILFMPSVLSGLVISIMFMNFVENVLPVLFDTIGLTMPADVFMDPSPAFNIQIFFVIWVGFGTQLILYSGAMSRIPASLIEAGKLDGMNLFQEFWYITLPSIFQTISIFLITGVAGIFTSQLALYTFYKADAPQQAQTLGYYFFIKVLGTGESGGGLSFYPEAAAAGLIFTAIAAPLTLFVRYLLEKFGPSVEF